MALATPFSGKEGGGGNLVKAIRPKPWPGEAPGLLFGRTTALHLPLQPLLGCSGGTFHGHFRVLKNETLASKVQGGKQGGAHTALYAQHQSQVPTPGQTQERWGEGGGRSAAAPAGGHADPCRLSPPARVQGKRAGGASSQGTAAVPMITLSPQAGGVYEGFGNYYNHLLC